MEYAALFPGQGSQVVGMGAALFEAWPELLGDRADEVLGWSLRSACLEGPLDRLTPTDVAQPALYAVAYAAWTAWASEIDQPPGAVAGHSLGELTALAAAGVLDFYDGLALVAARGRAMAAAAAEVPSGMAAVMGADPQDLETICEGRRRDGGQLWVANLNAPGQTVVAGAAVDIEWLTKHASDLGLRRVIPLEVAGAFHTPLMEGAVATFADALADSTFSEAGLVVWSNVDARPYGSDVADSLLRQLTSPVLFAESLVGIAGDGVGAFLGVGPGNVTAGMARRAVDGAVTASVEDASGISDAAIELGLSVE